MNGFEKMVFFLGHREVVLEVTILLELVVDPVNKGKFLLFREAVSGSCKGEVRREEKKGRRVREGEERGGGEGERGGGEMSVG